MLCEDAERVWLRIGLRTRPNRSGVIVIKLGVTRFGYLELFYKV